MKKWNKPELAVVEIKETAKQDHQNGNTHGKVCKFNPSLGCNAQGNGNGICNGCVNNPATETLS